MPAAFQAALYYGKEQVKTMSSKTPDKLFEKSAFGYRPEDVDRYIDQLNGQIHALEAEKQDLLDKMKILAEKINEYRKEEGALRDALLGAQKMGNTIVAEAKTKADMMITDAKTRSERLIYEAQKTADETLGGLRGQVDREKMTLAKMEKAVADFKSKLLSIYKAHLNLISNLPDMEEEYQEFYSSRMAAAHAETETPAPEAETEAQPEPAQPEEQPVQVPDPPEASETSEESEPSKEPEVSTMRFDKVEKDAPAAPAASHGPQAARPGRKLSFEEKFGDLKFGKNNPTHGTGNRS